MSGTTPTAKTRLKRLHQRGAHDRATIDAILDAGLIAHVGFVFEGYPVVTPTLCWREGDHVYWHGSSASRMLRAAEGAEVCLTVTHLDALVCARSAFHHSANYRSVMLFGTAAKVAEAAQAAHLRAFVEGLYPGRWEALRPITAQELKATTTLMMPIDEASAKLRTGGPVDDAEDMDVPVWAGVLPLLTRAGAPEADATARAAGHAAPVLAARLERFFDRRASDRAR